MTDGASLIAACRANPSDDAPRLIYTDWLEENGQEARAEFIRLGIELFKWEMYPGDRFGMIKLVGKEFRFKPTYKAIKRERELLDEHGIDVLLGEPAYQWDYWKPYISRGMVEALKMPAEAWCAFADKYLLTIQPIRDVYLETLPVLYMKSTGRERYGGSEKFTSTLEETGLIYQSGSNDDWAIAEPALKERWPDITFHYTPPARNLRAGMLMGTVSSTGQYASALLRGETGERRTFAFQVPYDTPRISRAEVIAENPDMFLVDSVRLARTQNGLESRVECEVVAISSGLCRLRCHVTNMDGTILDIPAMIHFGQPTASDRVFSVMPSRERRTHGDDVPTSILFQDR